MAPWTFQRRRVERELDDELAFHVEMETQAHISRGMNPVEARRAALKDFGATVQANVDPAVTLKSD